MRTHRTINVEVPAGVEHGTRIRMTGQGEIGPGGGPAGDLYIEIQETRHPTLRRRGDNVYTEVTVPATSAILGTEIDIETLDGKKPVAIPAGTQPGTSIKLSGLGVGRLHRRGRGDLVVIVDVAIPTSLSKEQRELVEQLANLRDEKRREPAGMIDKLRGKFA